MTRFLACAFALAYFAIPVIAQTTRPTTAPTPENWVANNPQSPVVLGAKLQHLSGGFSFTEGATSDADGNVFFVDQPNDRIMKWSVDGVLSTWLQPSGCANGMSFDAKGNLIACADEKNELWSIAPDKTITVLLKDFNGKTMNGPNDVWIRPDGGMYLTDPFYKRPWWPPAHAAAPTEPQGVFYVSSDRQSIKRVIDDLRQANGIIGTPDGKTLYVSDIRDGKTYSYSVKEDGSVVDKKLFAGVGSDGMTIDSDGNVYTTSRGAVQIFDPFGKQLDTIPVPGANCCFGGKDGTTLFITARTELWALQMKTHRVGPQ